MLGVPNPSTSYSLFDRLRQDASRNEAMRQFVERYTFFIINRIRKTVNPIQQDDIANIAQDIFLKVLQGLIQKSFSKDRSNFRKWFAVVIKNEVLLHLRRRKAKHIGKGDAGLIDVAMSDEANAIESQTMLELELYELENAQTVVSQEVRPVVWDAFYLSAYGEKDSEGLHRKLSAAEIGLRLQITPERVHAYKFKVLQRLREILSDSL